jgi:hypothetical protein
LRALSGFYRVEVRVLSGALERRLPRNAEVAAKYPHIPCTPPPGGVADEQI